LSADDRILAVVPDHPTVLADEAFLDPALAPQPKARVTMGPDMVPLDRIATREQLAAAIDAEKVFLHLAGRWAAPEERLAHEAYLRSLVDFRDHGNAGIVERARIDEQRQRVILEKELAQLGDMRGCKPGETASALAARRDELRLARQVEREAREDEPIYMGEDGSVGTRRDLAACEVRERLELANPGSGTGALLAGIEAARGGSLDDIRAAGQLGNSLEGVAGGVGRIVERDVTQERTRAPERAEIAADPPALPVRPNLRVKDLRGSWFATRPNDGAIVKAIGRIEGSHPGRSKARPPEPMGGRAPGDHRGHLIPEGGVRDPSKVNVRENIISESSRSNLGPKKSFDLLASKIADRNPSKVVTTTHQPLLLGDSLRPVAVDHRILVDGEVVCRVMIPNR
jgi:hypothetical protein